MRRRYMLTGCFALSATSVVRAEGPNETTFEGFIIFDREMDFQSNTSLSVSVFYPFSAHGETLAGDGASIPNSRNPWGFTLQVNAPREDLDTDLAFSAQVWSNDKLVFAGGAGINGISAASKPIRLVLAYQLRE